MVRYLLEAQGVLCSVVSTALDAKTALQSSCTVFLWDNTRAFAFIDPDMFAGTSHVFFAPARLLVDAGVTVLDSNPSSASLLGTPVDRLSAPIDFTCPVVQYLRNTPDFPELMFSREVKRTAAQKKKDTDPSFLAGSLLRQGFKEILDMCGHVRETTTHLHLLSFILALDTDSRVSVPAFNHREIQAVLNTKDWASVSSFCSERAYSRIIAMIASRSHAVPLDGISFEDRTRSALGQISAWFKTPYAPFTLSGLLLVLSGVPEGRAVYESGSDSSSLNLLCRNINLIRPNINALRPFFVKE
jgi:hypothetical protein